MELQAKGGAQPSRAADSGGDALLQRHRHDTVDASASAASTASRFHHDFSHVPARADRPPDAVDHGAPSWTRGAGAMPWPSLMVSAPDDANELDADRVADAVMRGEEARPMRSATIPMVHHRKASEGAAAGGGAPPIVHEVLGSAGRPLDPSTRTLMESRIGYGLGAVRVHTGARASASAQAVSAMAYTVGSDVVFDEGRYDPASRAGRWLLAHELAHVAQQRGGSVVQRKLCSEEKGEKDVKSDVGAEEEIEPLDELEPSTDDSDEGAVDSDEELAAKKTKEAVPKVAEVKGGKSPVRPLRRRRKNHRSRSFAGRGANWFGGTRGKYLRYWAWTLKAPETEREPSTQQRRTVELRGNDTGEIPWVGNTHGGAVFYDNETIIGRAERQDYERNVSIYVDEPKPSLAFNEQSTTLSVRRTAKGTLTYQIGDADDPDSGPKAQVLLQREVLGFWVDVYDTGFITTHGVERSVDLKGLLQPDSNYRVRVCTDYWYLHNHLHNSSRARTQVGYALHLSEELVKKVRITKTIAGKSVVTKPARKFVLRL